MSSNTDSASAPTLDSRVRRGLAWSAVNNIVVRFAGLGVGIILARLLTPEDFGVFAVAITVQLILVTLAELGISADLIRRGDIARRGPTVATISLAASASITLIMVLTARPVATLMGSAAATPVVQVMALTLLLSGLSIVPYATMQREFMQSKQLIIDASSLVLSTAVTVGLVYLFDVGAMSLAIGRIAGQLLTTGLQIGMTRIVPRFGWNRQIAREVLGFGLPIAVANLLSWVILNVDNMLVGHNLGAVALGLYVLAFNLSSWPMNAVGLTIRSVALPAFSRLGEDRDSLQRAIVAGTTLTAALSIPLGALLIVYADPVILFLYGEKWTAASSVLKALGAFGIVRVIFDLFAAYLYSRGRSRSVLVVQLIWLVTLAPAMMIGIQIGQLVGAGWAHVAVGVGVLLPAYLVALNRSGVQVAPILGRIVVAALACCPPAAVAVLTMPYTNGPFLTLLVGCSLFLLVYTAITFRWIRRLIRQLRSVSSSGSATNETFQTGATVA